ncbi:MAG: hypothetical protein JSW08_04060 [archaeon]|nr:MAG: hypothetical protein JSW08_04060 [archaeon]
MIEKEHTLRVLKKTIKTLKARDMTMLRTLSNQTIHTASVYQDPDAIALAVTIYALSKIVERENYRHYPDWKPFIKSCLSYLDKTITYLEKGDMKRFRNNLMGIRGEIENISSKLKEYIKEVFRKAAISKASRIYEHGISRAETAKLLGITQWELAEYVGRTGIADIRLSVTRTVRDRIKLAQSLFK